MSIRRRNWSKSATPSFLGSMEGLVFLEAAAVGLKPARGDPVLADH